MNQEKFLKQQELELIIRDEIKNSQILINFSLILEKINYQPCDDFLYHYTKFLTAEKIIKNSEFWGTHLSYMNDSKELIDGLDTLNKFLERIDERIKSISDNKMYFMQDLKPSVDKSEVKLKK